MSDMILRYYDKGIMIDWDGLDKSKRIKVNYINGYLHILQGDVGNKYFKSKQGFAVFTQQAVKFIGPRTRPAKHIVEESRIIEYENMVIVALPEHLTAGQPKSMTLNCYPGRGVKERAAASPVRVVPVPDTVAPARKKRSALRPVPVPVEHTPPIVAFMYGLVGAASAALVAVVAHGWLS